MIKSVTVQKQIKKEGKIVHGPEMGASHQDRLAD
jgi:hypothetical protein